MNNEDQRKLFDDLPMDNPDGAKKEKSPNILQEILAEVMSERGLEMADIVKATGIKFPTLHDWVKGNVQTQKMDENLWKLARYLNLSLEYLCFGVGSDEPVYKDFDEEETKEEKRK